MTTTLNPRTKIINPLKETIQFEYNKAHGSVIIPKRLKWSDVLNSGEWDLEEAVLPEEPKSLTNISQVLKNPATGLVRIKFDKNPDLNFNNDSCETSSSQFSTTNLPTHIQGIQITKNISEPVYLDKTEPHSPTLSDMDFTNISNKYL